MKSALGNPLDRVKDRVQEAWEALSQEPNDLSATRDRLTKRWGKKPGEVLAKVDEAMADMWGEKGDGSLWGLNRLLYAGAITANEIGEEQESERKKANDLESEPESEPEESGARVREVRVSDITSRHLTCPPRTGGRGRCRGGHGGG